MRETDSPRVALPSLDGVDALDQRSTKALGAVVEDLAGELSLRPLLERILKHSTELLGSDAGSICLVDEAAGVYRKEADIGIACQSGKVFPLTEGTTGALVAARGPVIFENYADVPGGHVRPEDREALKGVIGVPIWWRGEIVGSLRGLHPGSEPRVRPETTPSSSSCSPSTRPSRSRTRGSMRRRNRTPEREAAAAERNRMAREVHDTVAQGLVSVMLQLRQPMSPCASIATATSIGDRRARRGWRPRPSSKKRGRSVLGLAPSPARRPLARGSAASSRSRGRTGRA